MLWGLHEGENGGVEEHSEGYGRTRRVAVGGEACRRRLFFFDQVGMHILPGSEESHNRCWSNNFMFPLRNRV
jgi:hypothetical protein